MSLLRKITIAVTLFIESILYFVRPVWHAEVSAMVIKVKGGVDEFMQKDFGGDVWGLWLAWLPDGPEVLSVDEPPAGQELMGKTIEVIQPASGVWMGMLTSVLFVGVLVFLFAPQISNLYRTARGSLPMMN